MRAFPLSKAIFGSAVVIFLMAPLFAILPLAFTDSVFLNYPIPDFSLRWFDELFTADAWRRSIINSLIIGAGTTVLATVLGTVASLGLRGKSASLLFGFFRTVFLLPMVVPAVVLGVGMQLMFAQYGLANTYLGVIVAHTVIAIPFVVVNVTAALQGIDRRLENAAASLGASPTVVLKTVTLPLAMPGIISGAVFAFATSLDEVVLTLFVAGPNQRTVARQMFSTIRENISPAIAAAAFLFIAGTVLIAALAYFVRRKRQVA
ncbi:ABC transporter permease subunit [Sinorhizobium meliloti]|uniref:ABC transporter permease n=1 Tax=Rhizobium meliloti TaxID=382 RepID=UPI00041E4A76|nr:ABC transporter permease [Sinorhizobium meliloti]MDW9356874.1 ABC transporter permease subunit [Sinorhizobium meliloti]MDW9414972.1 ABC transporter permease subunit [Sinorhizobium meliloti]MDW9460054.1 ABC transporter permease subunit [Sinorhizobium meliloti]MDW9479844.1 ABC transporter permease subunit [Sinorhizobium meliloti]MDW9510167.1 ABC transporter permease subunit [Sinorhizobium meliloti]